MVDAAAHLDQSASNADSPALLSVRDLRVEFPVRGGGLFCKPLMFAAVDGVSFDIPRGGTLGLVGESGSGKSTVGRAILRLVHASAGRVIFDDRNLFDLPRELLRKARRDIGIVFQDPAGSLNPRLRIEEIVGEPLLVHGEARAADLRRRVATLLERCDLPASAARRFPHQFSGGQRQRIAIARAIALQPRFLICDEPTSALDVSVQAQILNLLKDLQDERGLSYLFISHDMAVIDHMCARVAVMREGRIVEQGDREAVMTRPQHEYTRELLAAVPGMSVSMS